MPKETRDTRSRRSSYIRQPRADSVDPSNTRPAQRSAAIWTPEDDEQLAQARSRGENWQPIATKYFPTKTANACRKRHERLMEHRNQDSWEDEKLDDLASIYMECRKDMWSMLADRLGERWSLVEAKCMEKGLKDLQAIARSSQRRHSSTELVDERGNDEHEGDSGLGLSDAEKEAGDARNSTTSPHVPRPLQPLPAPMQNRQNAPPYLPLYEPPPNVRNSRPTTYDQSRPHSAPLGPFRQCHLPGSQTQRGCISIQSMLLPTDPRRL